MSVKVFYGENSQYEHEFKQICEIYRYLVQSCGDKEIYLLTNFLTGNNEYDCVILRENAIIILELKSQYGQINGGENGSWEVISETGKSIPLDNVFQQIRGEKFSLIDKLKPIREKHFPRIDEDDLKKIQCWAYFKKGSSYDKSQISASTHIWFDVITIDDLGRKLQYANSRILLTKKDMDAIVDGLYLRHELSDLCKSLTKMELQETKSIIKPETILTEENIHHWGGNIMTKLVEFDGNCPKSVSQDAKYSVRNNEGEWIVGLVYETINGEKWYPVSEKHPELVEMVNRIKKEINKKPGGSFYINEYKQVIVPNVRGKTYYLAGEYSKPLEFEFEQKILSGDAKDPSGKSLSVGDDWDTPHPGIPYVFAVNNDIYYKREIRRGVIQEFRLSLFQKPEVVEKICNMISSVKKAAGRFYINEFGHIFTPITQNSVKYTYIGKLENLNEWFPKPTGKIVDYDGKNE
jgi:hypothetical protein